MHCAIHLLILYQAGSSHVGNRQGKTITSHTVCSFKLNVTVLYCGLTSYCDAILWGKDINQSLSDLGVIQ